jgi:hypothetical protein
VGQGDSGAIKIPADIASYEIFPFWNRQVVMRNVRFRAWFLQPPYTLFILETLACCIIFYAYDVQHLAVLSSAG